MKNHLFVFAFITYHLLLVKVSCEETTEESFKDVGFDEYKRHPRETNIVNFFRLVVFRLIYGFAHLFGFGESISEVGDGIFVPPGADDDYGFGGGDDDDGFKDYGGSDDDYY